MVLYNPSEQHHSQNRPVYFQIRLFVFCFLIVKNKLFTLGCTKSVRKLVEFFLSQISLLGRVLLILIVCFQLMCVFSSE